MYQEEFYYRRGSFKIKKLDCRVTCGSQGEDVPLLLLTACDEEQHINELEACADRKFSPGGPSDGSADRWNSPAVRCCGWLGTVYRPHPRPLQGQDLYPKIFQHGLCKSG